MAWSIITCSVLSSLLVLIVIISQIPLGESVLAKPRKDYTIRDMRNHSGLEAWRNAGIGELCISEENLLAKIALRPNDTKYRKKMALKYCGASPKLSCSFEVPDLKEIIRVCDCADKAETWDEAVKQCRRFAGRKQTCTDDSQCISGSTCKNEAAKLRDYSRWETELLKLSNITTPRTLELGSMYGKNKTSDIDNARRTRIRILSRIVRSSFKEEMGECTCTRKELNLDFVNKTDPCISRKVPPSLHINDGNLLLIPPLLLILSQFILPTRFFHP